MHPRLENPARPKPTNGANGRHRAALRKTAKRPATVKERHGTREETQSPFVEKSRAWVLALRGGVILSLATFALVALSQGLSSPVLRARDSDLVPHSFELLPANPDLLSNGALAATWPLEDGPSEGGAQAPPESLAEGVKAGIAKEEEGPAAAEAGTASRSVARAARERRPQGPSAGSADSAGGPGRHGNGAKRRTSVAIEEEKIVSKPAAPKPRVLTTEPEPTFRPRPVYPPSALKKEVEGTVRVKFLVTTTGSVKNVEVLSAQPPDQFDANVKEAVSQWRFVPGKDQNGKPMEAEQVYTYRFKLEVPGA